MHHAAHCMPIGQLDGRCICGSETYCNEDEYEAMYRTKHAEMYHNNTGMYKGRVVVLVNLLNLEVAEVIDCA